MTQTKPRLVPRILAATLLSATILLANLAVPNCGQSQDVGPKVAEPRPAVPAASGTSAGPKTEEIELSPADPVVAADEGFVSIDAKTKGTDVRWLILSPSKVKYAILGQTVIVSVPAPGSVIHIYAWTAIEGKPTNAARTILTVKGAAPGPNPTPNPQPPDQAIPTGPLFIIIIDDAANRPKFPYMAQIINSAGLRQSTSKAGHTLKVVDVSDKGLDAKGFRAEVNKTGVPAILLIDKAGVMKCYPCPKTPNDIVALINKTVQATSRTPREED